MKIRKAEESYLQKFKNQVKISKAFGKEAIKVYNAIPKESFIDAEKLQELTGFDKEFIMKIIEFMEKEAMLVVESEEMKKGVKQPVKKEIVREEREEIVIEKPVEKPEIEKMEEEKEKERVEFEKEFEIKPETEMEKKEIKEEKVEKEEVKEEKVEEELPTFEEEIKPEFETVKTEEAPKKFEETTEIEEEKALNLTKEEQDIYQSFGESGIEVYRALKEGKSIKDISISLGMNERDVKDIESFLVSKNYISKPKQEAVEEEDKYAPLTGVKEEYLTVEKEEDKINYVKLKKIGFIDKIKVKFGLVMKYKKYGRLIFEDLEKKMETDVITLVENNRVSIDKVEAILNDLKKQGVIEMKPLTRDEIRKRFGYDSLAVYRKYGKAGVIMYDLVGKDLMLKEIAELAGLKDKEKIYEIFSFIHRLLGIEIPIDKTLIMKQLE